MTALAGDCLLPRAPRSYYHNSIAELYDRYKETLEDRYFTDRCGDRVYFTAEGFPHLVKLEFYDRKQGRWVEAVAGPTIANLRARTLDEGLHRIADSSRPRTLFWIPEVIQTSDAIHDHKHRREVNIYVRRYEREKKADPLKFVLVEKRRESGLLVVKTSFWTNDRYLGGCAVMPAKYIRRE